MEDFEKLEQSAEIVDETVEEIDAPAEIPEDSAEFETAPALDEPETDDVPAFGDAEIETAPAAKKKMKIQTPIIIAAGIVLLAILAFACFKLFFDNSVVGTWVIDDTATSDEATEASSETTAEEIRYYTFEKDHTASITLGTMKVVGTWYYADDNSATTDQATSKIKVEISYFFNGVFDIELKGNAFSGRTLSLSGENLIKPIDFKSSSLPENTLKPSDKFKAVGAITGKWKNDEYNLTYTFNPDGTCTLNQVDTLIVDGVYTVDEKKGTIEIKYLQSDEDTMTIEYKADKSDSKKITFSGLEYTRVEE